MSHKFKKAFLGIFIAFCLLLLAIVGFLNYKSQNDSENQLTKSVKAQLVAACVAAREVINPDEFAGLNSREDTDKDANYAPTLAKLRNIAVNVGAKYIYALKRQADNHVFVFDTDAEADTRFVPYDISKVHADAFAGKMGADIMNVKDEYGSFSTGAVPILRDGAVIGVVSADIEDKLLSENRRLAKVNTWLLIGSIIASMAAMTLIMTHLLHRIKNMQDKLSTMAHYDTVTGLPNRLCLLEYLNNLKNQARPVPFALYFIDLDNFKKVNDVAGHDAGDILLQRIGAYLGRQHGSRSESRVFRPAAGKLNIAARVGGDEFVIVVPNVSGRKDAEEIAKQLLSGFASEEIDDHIKKFHVGMSIGIALYPSQAEDYNVIIKYADIAMYHAKNAGKNTYRVYDDELTAKVEK